MKRNITTVVLAFVFSIVAVLVGYIALGLLPAFVFTFGFLGGFFIWLFMPMKPNFSQFRLAYFLTLLLFVFHKVEERKMDFFPELSKITGVAVPDTSSILVYLLYAIAGTWLFIPLLVSRKNDFGNYLAWTFFASMGITELAHFVFPFFTDKPYGYFPGMASVIFLAPAAWWGMYKLSRQ